MIRTDLERLGDARRYAQAALAATDQDEFVRLWATRERRPSLLLDIILIGEALAKVSAATRSLAAEVPWTAISWTRNRLVHVYWLQERQFIEGLLASDLRLLLESLNRLIGVLEGPA